MDGVVDKVGERWLASIDKEEPEIVDEFLQNMKSAVAEIHTTEGYPKGKIMQAREGGDDWLVKVVDANKKMQNLIPAHSKEDRVAVFDSWITPYVNVIEIWNLKIIQNSNSKSIDHNKNQS